MIAFLTAAQIEALGTAIQEARKGRGIHQVCLSDGEVFAYQFNDEVHWHVNNAQAARVAKGTVPLQI